MMALTGPALSRSITRAAWQDRLATLPSSPKSIPSFFYGHGSLLLAFSRDVLERDTRWHSVVKYILKGILVFSAHWEGQGDRLVTDYGDENPLLMDYEDFDLECYTLKFSSRGEATLSRRVVHVFQNVLLLRSLNLFSGKPRWPLLHRLFLSISRTKPAVKDGRCFEGPGLDHGVFVPFRRMFGEDLRSVPIVQASIGGSLTPEANWALGKAITGLRKEGILILSGGFTVHNLEDHTSFLLETAGLPYRQFNDAVVSAISVSDPGARKTALVNLTQHESFRLAHPREDHFVPIYVVAGAGEEGGSHVLSGLYGCQAVAFGV